MTLPRLCLLAIVAACNPVVAHLPDSAVGQKDAPVDSAPQLVTVTVFDQAGTGVPSPGVPVAFIDPDGTAVAHPVTDVHGKASAEVKAGASVTAVFQVSPTSYQLITILAVKPGDNIILDAQNSDYSDAGTFAVTFSAATNATGYTVLGPCGSTFVTAPGTVALPMYKYCKLDQFEVQVQAQNSAGTSVGYVSAANVMFSAGAVTMPTAYTSFTTVAATYSNINQVAYISAERFSPADDNYYTNGAGANPSSTSLVLSVAGPRSSTAAMRSQFQDPNGMLQHVTEPLDPTTTTYAFDVAGTLLPWFGTLTFDPATAKLSVPTSTVGTTTDAPDAAVFRAGYNRLIDMTTQTYQTVGWTILSPTATDITLPKLPADLAVFNPKAADNPLTPIGIMFESSAIDGYDAVRPNPEMIFNSINVLRGSTAKVRVSQTPFRG